MTQKRKSRAKPGSLGRGRRKDSAKGRRPPPGYPKDPKIARLLPGFALTWDKETYQPITQDGIVPMVVAIRLVRDALPLLIELLEVSSLWFQDVHRSEKGDDVAT